ncbi:unnamed protein product [Victoria cruziana]
MTTKIRIVIRSFEKKFLENPFGGLPQYTRQIGLPESRVKYTVLQSPHIDQKSREQFGKKETIDAQYEILFSCKTRSDKGKPLMTL